MSLHQPLLQHAQRNALHNEIHARPPESMTAPLAISHVVMACNADQRAASRAHVAALLSDHHLPQLDAQSTHIRMDIGAFRIRWELHTEFITWTFTRSIESQGFGEREPPTAIQVVPQAWLAALPGECLAAMHLWVLPTSVFGSTSLVRHVLLEDTLVASTVADGHGEVYTDFAIHADNFSRMVLLTGGMTPRRLGRLVQRLLDIETYRMAALMGLPAARETGAWLADGEAELAALAEQVQGAAKADEAALLDRLTRLAAALESRYAATHTRFSASAAYFSLVEQRLADIAETRIEGMQSLHDFMQRRLLPAMHTCRSADRRQAALSQRIERTSSLLRTRVEVEQQQSNRELLAGMNRRQELQLKLQSTVEGLSVAAISYYVLGLLGYLFKGAQSLGWPFSAEASIAVAVPLVVALVWWSLRQLHHRVMGRGPDA